MRNLSSWLLLMFLILFWIFRIAVTLSFQYGRDFGGFTVIDNTTEIAMLFVTILCVIFIVRRWALGGIIYMLGYGYYFGKYILDAIPTLTSGENVDFVLLQNVIVGALAVFLGFFIVLDILIEKIRRKNYSDNKTDWFFKNKKSDRKLDERADKNQYRTL